MDGLALFCNLHADGPRSLEDLRRAGLHTLVEVGELPEERLIELFGVSERVAARLLVEARALADRLGEFGLEPEEAPLEEELDEAEDETVAMPSSNGDAGGEAGEGLQEAGEDEELEDELFDEEAREEEPRLEVALVADSQPVGEASDLEDDARVRDVLAAWRDEDSREPPEALPDHGVLMPSPRSKVQHASPRPLEPHLIEGLDRGLCDRLRERVATLGELLEASALGLSKSTGIPYTRLLRLQFLARRLLLTEGLEDSSSVEDAPPAGAPGPGGPFG